MSKGTVTYQEALVLTQSAMTHPFVLATYEHADQVSKNQTKHDSTHGTNVVERANQIVKLVEELQPGRFDAWTKNVIIPIAALLHDIGRCIDIDRHDIEGARWARDFLEDVLLTTDGRSLPTHVINRIAVIIRFHRTSQFKKFCKKQERLPYATDNADVAVVVLADKCEGDENRVRPERVRMLRALLRLGVPQLADLGRPGGVHDRVNYAIKAAVIERSGTVLELAVDLDERVCMPLEVWNLYSKRFGACDVAADLLGMSFRLKFNGVPFVAPEDDIDKPLIIPTAC